MGQTGAQKDGAPERQARTQDTIVEQAKDEEGQKMPRSSNCTEPEVGEDDSNSENKTGNNALVVIFECLIDKVNSGNGSGGECTKHIAQRCIKLVSMLQPFYLKV